MNELDDLHSVQRNVEDMVIEKLNLQSYDIDIDELNKKYQNKTKFNIQKEILTKGIW